jgi:hypothetical protein
MWSADANDSKCLEGYSSLVDKDQTSKGDFLKDYDSNCTSNGIIKCPYITSYSVGDKEAIRVANGIIDLPSWRAMLLSLASIGSKVTELQIHSCTLSSQHLQDLGKAMNKHGLLKSLRIQYSEIFSPQDDIAAKIAAIRALLSDAANVEYISLKAVDLSDEIVKGIASAFTENFRLTGLNLSGNNLSDETCSTLLTSIRCNPNYKAVNLSNNNTDGTATAFAIINQYIGSVATGSEDGIIKANTKTLTEKNKAIKDLNKKRKKAGQPEFAEYPALPEFAKQIDGKSWFFNRGMECIDLTSSPFSDPVLTDMMKLLDTLPVSLVEESKLKLVFSSGSTSTTELGKYQNLIEFL